MLADLGRSKGIRAIIDPMTDAELGALMTNLGGHDIETHHRDASAPPTPTGDQPTCFIAYTIKGMGLPFAGHKDNHAGLMTKEQMEDFRAQMAIRDGHEWDAFEGLDADPAELRRFLADCPFATPLTPEGRALAAPVIAVPAALPMPKLAGRRMSTQSGFGDILAEIGRGQGEFEPLATHILTTSPDVTVSTNLGPWVNRRGIFDRHTRNDVFRDAKLASAQRWGMSPKGQHIELGIAEQNLFLLLGAAGLAHAFHGGRVLPIGTVYDPFVNRGLDALIYSCYQDARFLLVSTPSGLTLAPEGGQHQSINTPLIGISSDRLVSFEPAHVDELAILLRHAFDHMQKPDGSAVWLRLSTRQLPQPTRTLDPAAVIAGAHWVVEPAPGARLASPTRAPSPPKPRRPSPPCARTRRKPASSPSPAPTASTPAGSLPSARAGQAIAARSPTSSASWPRSPPTPRWSRCWTATPPRIPGWARCGGSAWCRWGRIGSGRAGIFRICTGSMGWMRRRFWRLARKPACAGFTVSSARPRKRDP